MEDDNPTSTISAEGSKSNISNQGSTVSESGSNVTSQEASVLSAQGSGLRSQADSKSSIVSNSGMSEGEVSVMSKQDSADDRKAHEDKIESPPKAAAGTLEGKMNNLDWKMNRKNIAIEMERNRKPLEIQIKDEEGLNEVGEYLLTSRKLGDTFLAEIFVAKSHTSDKNYAAKLIDLEKVEEKVKSHLKRNTYGILWFLKKSTFKHIVTVYGFFLANQTKLILIEDKMDFPLAYIVKAVGKLKPKEARRHTEGLANAIFFLHNAGIAHQNISGMATFVTPDKILKLGMLEYAIIYFDGDKEEIRQQQIRGKLPSTGIGFLPPEVHTGEPYDPLCVDVFSLGAIITLMILGRYPSWSNGSKDNMEAEIQDSIQETEKTQIEHMPDLVLKCLRLNPKERPSIREIVDHPWFSESLS